MRYIIEEVRKNSDLYSLKSAVKKIYEFNPPPKEIASLLSTYVKEKNWIMIDFLVLYTSLYPDEVYLNSLLLCLDSGLSVNSLENTIDGLSDVLEESSQDKLEMINLEGIRRCAFLETPQDPMFNLNKKALYLLNQIGTNRAHKILNEVSNSGKSILAEEARRYLGCILP